MNEIYELIEKYNFLPSEFEWAEEYSRFPTSCLIPVLKHSSSSFYFKIDFSGENTFYIVRSPGDGYPMDTIDCENPDHLMAMVEQWLGFLKTELDAPDLWASLASSKIPDALSHTDVENTPFSESELAYISTQIREIKHHLKSTQKLTTQQLELVEQRLSYLEKSARRVGRIDWNNILLGVMVNIVGQLALPPEAYGSLFRLLSAIFKKLLNPGPFLP